VSSLDESGHLCLPSVWGHHELDEAVLYDRIALERPVVVSVCGVDILRVGNQLTRTVWGPGFLFHYDGKGLLKRGCVGWSEHKQIETHRTIVPTAEAINPRLGERPLT